MMEFRRSISLITILLLVIFLLTGCDPLALEKETAENEAEEQIQPRTLKLGHVLNEQSCFQIAATKFKELVEEKTEGQIKVEIFSSGALGDEYSLLEGMQIGTVDMGIISNQPIARFIPEIAALEMPFLFISAEEAYKVLDGEVGQNLLKKLEAVNLKGLAFAERGYRNIINGKRPVSGPTNLLGLKLATIENQVNQDAFSTLGVNQVSFDPNNISSDLQEGKVDGQENYLDVININLFVNQKYFSLTNHVYSPAVIMMSKIVFDSFDQKTQGILLEAAYKASLYERKWNEKELAEKLESFPELGIEVITEINTDAFSEAVKPVYNKYQERYGQLIEKINKSKQREG